MGVAYRLDKCEKDNRLYSNKFGYWFVRFELGLGTLIESEQPYNGHSN